MGEGLSVGFVVEVGLGVGVVVEVGRMGTVGVRVGDGVGFSEIIKVLITVVINLMIILAKSID